MVVGKYLLKAIGFISLVFGSTYNLSGQLLDETDLILRVEKRIYSNSDYDLKIKIAEGYVFVNGQREYFNLSYHILSSNSGMIKGESVRNPNGRIKIYYDENDKCITNEGILFCEQNKVKETTIAISDETKLKLAEEAYEANRLKSYSDINTNAELDSILAKNQEMHLNQKAKFYQRYFELLRRDVILREANLKGINLDSVNVIKMVREVYNRKGYPNKRSDKILYATKNSVPLIEKYLDENETGRNNFIGTKLYNALVKNYCHSELSIDFVTISSNLFKITGQYHGYGNEPLYVYYHFDKGLLSEEEGMILASSEFTKSNPVNDSDRLLRKMTERNVEMMKTLSKIIVSESTRITFHLCVDSTGNVKSAEVVKEETGNIDIKDLEKCINAAYHYKFEESIGSNEDCGKVSSTITPSRN